VTLREATRPQQATNRRCAGEAAGDEMEVIQMKGMR
jgi:hypothetical protein